MINLMKYGTMSMNPVDEYESWLREMIWQKSGLKIK